jgi:hypothetical protein
MRQLSVVLSGLLAISTGGCNESTSNVDSSPPKPDVVRRSDSRELDVSRIDARMPDGARPDALARDAARADAWTAGGWAVSGGGASDDGGLWVAVDAAGNAYVTGYFVGQATFGTTTLTDKGTGDIFVAKLSATGQWLWAVSAGGTGDDTPYGLALDPSGNAYVAGFYAESATFGTTTLTAKGGTDAFVAKVSPSGQFAWAVSGGGTSTDAAYSVAVNAQGDIFVTGELNDQATFGATTLTSKGANDIFVAQVTPAGQFAWAVSAGGTTGEAGFTLALDAASNIYLTGVFTGQATLGTTNLSSQGDRDAFVAKLSPAGQFLWATAGGGIGADAGNAIAVDASGNSFVAGEFTGSATFGSTTLSSKGSTDVFVARLSPTGQFVWTTAAPGTGDDVPYGIALDDSGNILIAGTYAGAVTFGATVLSSKAVSADAFVAKLTSAGQFHWAAGAGGDGGDIALSIAYQKVGGKGAAYVTGRFLDQAVFGATALTSKGGKEMYLWQMTPQ